MRGVTPGLHLVLGAPARQLLLGLRFQRDAVLSPVASERPGLLQEVKGLLRRGPHLSLRLLHEGPRACLAGEVRVASEPGAALLGARVCSDGAPRGAPPGAAVGGAGRGGRRSVAQGLGERLVGLAEPLEDAIQPGTEAAEVLAVVAVGVEDAARLEVRQLHRLGGRAGLQPEDGPVVAPEQGLAGEDLPLAVRVRIHRFGEGILLGAIRAAGQEVGSLTGRELLDASVRSPGWSNLRRGWGQRDHGLLENAQALVQLLAGDHVRRCEAHGAARRRGCRACPARGSG